MGLTSQSSCCPELETPLQKSVSPCVLVQAAAYLPGFLSTWTTTYLPGEPCGSCFDFCILSSPWTEACSATIAILLSHRGRKEGNGHAVVKRKGVCVWKDHCSGGGRNQTPGVKLLENSVATKRKGKRGGGRVIAPPWALLERVLWVFNEAFLLCKPNCSVAWGSRNFLVGRDG